MIGERIGPYTIDRELGSGGMGKVYAATVAGRAPGLEEGARVALKVVHPHLLETEGFFMRFLREAQVGAAIQHENVVRTYMADALGHSHFLVMEYVEGQNLRDLLKELDRVPEELCRHIGREIARGLSAIHAAGVVHRDLKPENVLITPDHVVKVMDLGVAQLTEESIRLSHSGAFVGSAEYAAPEQFGGTVDHRCDLHALGLLLYELACGQHPYRADDFRTVMKRVCEEAPRRAGDINPQLSPFFEELVHTLLAKAADDRFADAGTLLSVLEEGESSAWWHARALALRSATSRPLRRIRIPRETAVYGRDTELDKLRALYARAKAGEGQVVLIEGEAGIGKSRLVDEMVARMQADGEDINFLFGSYPPGGAATASGAFSAAYREHFGEAGCADYLTQTPILVPAFDALLMGESAPTGVEQLTKDSLQTCFVNVTRSLAAERPTVVLIDDLHFAPDEGRALFTSLAMAVPGARVLLVGTTRPGVSEEWMAGLTRLDQTSQMALHRLGPKDLANLLNDSFKSSELAHALGVQVGIKSDGNPFFAFEIIRGLREGQFITQRDDGTWASTRIIDEIQIPSSVLDLVNARVADLTQEERDLLDVAACWGFEFDPVDVGNALGAARIPTLKQFAQIEKKHRLVRSQGRRYCFDHHQVQEALYGALNDYLREEYHAALAEALEARTKAAEIEPKDLDGALCVDLCEHYLKGARGESALRYLDAAQTHLSKGYLHAETAALTERALSVPGLLVGVQRAKVLIRLRDLLEVQGRLTRQEAAAREAESLAEDAGDDLVRDQATTALGWSLIRASRYEEAGAAFRRALDCARARGDLTAEAAAVGHLGAVLVSQGRLDEAREHLERSLAVSREQGDRALESYAISWLGVSLDKAGRFRDAFPYHERFLALSRELGRKRSEAIALANLGVAHSGEGRLVEARAHYEQALSIVRQIGDRPGEARVTGNLGALLARQGRSREARGLCERHLSLSREVGHREGEAIAVFNLGMVHRAEGDTKRSEDCLLTALAASEPLGNDELRAAALVELGSLRAATGDPVSAREMLEAVGDVQGEEIRPDYGVVARCELALLPGGDASDALAAWTEHEERLGAGARREARLLLWRATGDRGHLEEAKRLLDDALSLVPPDFHESMCRNVRVHREILAAWRAEFGEGEGAGEGVDDDDEPRGTESVTRVG